VTLYSRGTLNDAWITVDIFEDDLARVHEDQRPLRSSKRPIPTRSSAASLRVSILTWMATPTLQIRYQVNNPSLKLKLQILARVRIATQPGEALVIPQEALVFDTIRYFARQDRAGKLRTPRCCN
jgi:hypothetical protein